MSDAPESDPQEGAEALDEEVVDPLGDFPPERPLGVEENPAVPESYVERDERYEALDELREETFDEEWAEDAALVDVGHLVGTDTAAPDTEERLIGEIAEPGDASAEDAAISIRPEPGDAAGG